MQIKLIGIRASFLGHRIKPLARPSAAIIVVVEAGEEGMMRATMRRLQLIRIMVVGTVLAKFHQKSVGYAYSYDYGHGYSYGDLGALYSYGYSGAPDDPEPLAKPTLN